MTTRMSYYSAKFESAMAEVVHGKSLDQSFVDDMVGELDVTGVYVRIDDLYGKDYIVHTMESGRVEVEQFAHIDIDEDGYSSPIERQWDHVCQDVNEFLDGLGDQDLEGEQAERDAEFEWEKAGER